MAQDNEPQKNGLLARLSRIFHVKRQGPHYTFERAGRARVYTVYDPAILRAILKDTERFKKPDFIMKELERNFGKSILTDDGDSWQNMHNLLVSAFTPKMIHKNFAAVVSQECDAMIDRWLERKQPVDAEYEMRETGARIIGRAIFSSSIADDDIHFIIDSVNTVLAAQEKATNSVFSMLSVALRLPQFHVSRPSRSQRDAVARINAIIDPILQERKKLAVQPDDILGRLLTAKDAETGRTLTDQEIRDQAILFIVAGHETTAVALTFALTELLKHPEALRTVREQIDSVADNRHVRSDDFPRLPAVRDAFREAMRLHPSAYRLPREATAAGSYDNGIDYKKGDLFVLHIKEMHLDKELWEDAESYKPERFEKNPQPPAYMPFGAGPRVCLGLNMALVEGTLVLSEIFNRLNVSMLREPEGEQYSLSMRPKGNLLLEVSAKG